MECVDECFELLKRVTFSGGDTKVFGNTINT